MRTALAALLSLSLGTALAAAARADTLELKDGRVVEGAVDETPEGYRVRTRFGESLVAKADVTTLTRGKAIDDLVRERLTSLKADDAENRARLAHWLVDLGREDEGRALAEAALEIDAENAAAHAVLGHERHSGRWMTPDEAQRAKGLEFHDGKWWTAQEWQNLADSAKKAASDADAKTQQRRQVEQVNRLVRLMASPDLATRSRAKKALEDLAAETGNADLKRLPQQVEDYVKSADELARAAATGADAMVLGEIRVTLSKLKRPITTFETSLGNNIASAPVRIQLPELEVINLRTMVGIPAVVR